MFEGRNASTDVCLNCFTDFYLYEKLTETWKSTASILLLHDAFVGSRQKPASSTCKIYPPTLRCARSMAVLPALSTFTSELKATEYFLRGGLLDEPRMFTNLQAMEKRPFIRLCTRNRILRMFFSGQTKIFSSVLGRLGDVIAKIRDDEQDRLCTGDEESSQKRAAAMKKAQQKQTLLVTVPFPFGEETVNMGVLTVRTKNETPCVEASNANFRAMFCWCCIDVAKLEGVSPPCRAPPVQEARQGQLRKEFFRPDRRCWYMKRGKHPFVGDRVSVQKTLVCTRQTLGRPRKRSRAVGVSSDSGAAGDSNSALDSSTLSECTDSFQAASPSDSCDPEF